MWAVKGNSQLSTSGYSMQSFFLPEIRYHPVVVFFSLPSIKLEILALNCHKGLNKRCH